MKYWHFLVEVPHTAFEWQIIVAARNLADAEVTALRWGNIQERGKANLRWYYQLPKSGVVLVLP